MNNNINNASFIAQLYSLIILLSDYNNRDLMKELQTQDEHYLKRIIKQNEDIIKQNEIIIELLERRKKDG